VRGGEVWNLRDVEVVDVEDLTLGPGVGDHDRVVALHQTGAAKEESLRTHLASSAIALDRVA
jgi:hypothetical protein